MFQSLIGFRFGVFGVCGASGLYGQRLWEFRVSVGFRVGVLGFWSSHRFGCTGSPAFMK